MSVSALQVKELREKTGVGMMDCKKVLGEANGDFELAIKLLRERGLSAANKKADRSTNEGRIFAAVNAAGNKGVILELNCETDFVGSNEAFIQMGEEIANSLLSQAVNTLENIEALTVGQKSFKEFLSDNILKLGENMGVKRLELIETTGGLASYTHMNGKIAVLVEFSEAVSQEIGKDVSMHIAAASPLYLTKEEVPAAEVEAEREIIRNQIRQEGKPEAMVDKIAEGKIGKFFKDICLVDQAFVKDPSKSVQQILPATTQIVKFVRYAQ